MLFSCKVSDKKFKNVDFEEHVLTVNRVVKVVKGGRIFSFSVLVAIGNKNGYFGIGLGKALEVNEARKKAINNAKKNLYHVVLTKARTIPHEIKGKYCASRILVRPGKPGAGVIAGGCARVILECIGIKDVVAKCIGSTNPYNVSMSTLEALLKLRSPKYFSSLRKNASNFVAQKEEDMLEDKDTSEQ